MNTYIEIDATDSPYSISASELLQQKDVEEIRILVDTAAGPVQINLPESALLNRVVNQKVLVIDNTGNAAANNITVSRSGADTINAGVTMVMNQNNQEVEFKMFSLGKWGAYISSSTAPFAPFLTNLIYVDDVNGDDATGLPYRIDKPFKTIAAAELVAIAGDTLYMYPGTYNDFALGVDQVNYYFVEGAIMSSPSSCFSDVGTGGITVRIGGYGRFLSATVAFLINEGSDFIVTGQDVSGADGAISMDLGSTATFKMEQDIVANLGNAIVINGIGTTCFVDCRNISARSTCLATVLGDATTQLIVNANLIQTKAGLADAFGINNVGGIIKVHCNLIEKVNPAGGAAAVQIHPAAAAGSVVELYGNMSCPATGIIMNLAGSGRALIHGDAIGGGRVTVSGSTGIHRWYGDLECDTEAQVALTVTGGTLFYSGAIRHSNNSVGAHGITKAAGLVELASDVMIICANALANCITGGAGQVYEIMPGVSSNVAADAGIVQDGGVITVSANYF